MPTSELLTRGKDPKGGYVYTARVKVTGPRALASVEWTITFLDPGTHSEVGRHRFITKRKLKPGDEVDLSQFSKIPPATILDARRGEVPSEKDLISKVTIKKVEYVDDQATNDEVARRLAAARIPVLAVNFPVGNAPLYAADNREAGRLAGDALGKFALTTWRGRLLAAAILGATKDPSKTIQDRIAGITGGLRQQLPDVVPIQLDSGGNFLDAQAQLRRFLAKETGAMALVATLDDTTALAAKLAAETAGRVPDTVIVSQGCDPSVRGGVSSNKAIDPNNRNSIVLGSVAYFLDRYGSEILPLALKMLRGEPVPPRSFTGHVVVTAKNVFKIYPPIDIN